MGTDIDAIISQSVSQSILDAKTFKLDRTSHKVKLDQNEFIWDWPLQLKEQVCKKLASKSWNRYPVAFDDDLANKIKKYYEFPDHVDVLLSPGSNQMIVNVLNAFLLTKKNTIHISHPSFPLYASHSKMMDFKIKLWPFADNFEFDENLLDGPAPGDVIAFASPNNPTGSMLSFEKLDTILQKYPQCLVIADEAYYELCSQSYTKLLERDNLLIIRTFSKTLASANIRLGVLAGHPKYLGCVKKFLLPFSVNHFTNLAASAVIESPDFKTFIDRYVDHIQKEKDFIFESLQEYRPYGIQPIPTEANFFLLRLPSESTLNKLVENLDKHSILARKVNVIKELENCIRITMGERQENEQIVQSIKDSISA